MAVYYRTTPDEIRSSLAQQGAEANIANGLRTRKAVEAIVKNADVTDAEWVEEAPNPENKDDGKAVKKPKKATKAETGETKKKTAKKEKKS